MCVIADAGFPEHVTTLIGISVSGKPVSGVIYQPFFGSSGRMVWGMVGVGMRGTELKPREGEGLVITVTRSHMSKPVQDTVDNIKPLEVKLACELWKCLQMYMGNLGLFLHVLCAVCS